MINRCFDKYLTTCYKAQQVTYNHRLEQGCSTSSLWATSGPWSHGIWPVKNSKVEKFGSGRATEALCGWIQCRLGHCLTVGSGLGRPPICPEQVDLLPVCPHLLLEGWGRHYSWDVHPTMADQACAVLAPHTILSPQA